MQTDSNTPMDENRTDSSDGNEVRPEQNKLVRLLKSIIYRPEAPGPMDEQVISSRFYNSFNYSLISNAGKESNLTIGITSAKQGEGKTLVSSNLAVFLAMGSQRKTVLVDLNIQKPRLHKIFGAPPGPGLADALGNGSIHVSPTKIEHLFVLAGGQRQAFPITLKPDSGTSGSSNESSLWLEHIAAFRDVLYSLEQEFEYIIVDMPSINSEDFPTVLAYQFNGILIVMHTGKTKREEIEKIFRHFNQNHVLGFVLNHYDDRLH